MGQPSCHPWSPPNDVVTFIIFGIIYRIFPNVVDSPLHYLCRTFIHHNMWCILRLHKCLCLDLIKLKTHFSQGRRMCALVVKWFCNFQASLNLKSCALSSRTGMLSSAISLKKWIWGFSPAVQHTFILVLVSPLLNMPLSTATAATCLSVTSTLNGDTLLMEFQSHHMTVTYCGWHSVRQEHLHDKKTV